MFEGDYESLDKFATFLMANLKTWKAFQIVPWLNGESSSSKAIRGEHTKEFTKNTHKICKKRITNCYIRIFLSTYGKRFKNTSERSRVITF